MKFLLFLWLPNIFVPVARLFQAASAFKTNQSTQNLEYLQKISSRKQKQPEMFINYDTKKSFVPWWKNSDILHLIFHHFFLNSFNFKNNYF